MGNIRRSSCSEEEVEPKEAPLIKPSAIVKLVDVKAWRCPNCQRMQIARKSGNHIAECASCDFVVDAER